ncbi:MAG: outer membrane protein transport protein [Planctomycetales bacterium]|nr:outer membrane protein transport protein [Planctomycetales bacterium]
MTQSKRTLVSLGWVASLFFISAANAQGIFLPAGGAVNRGMGGATTGTAVESLGSMYWNPATINRLETDEMAFGFELVYADQNLSSAFPLAGQGSTDADTGVVPVPTISWVHHTKNPDVSIGLGIFGVGGFAINLPADAANPILSPPQTLGGVGVGGINSEAQFFQLAPALSVRLTERLSMAAGPVVGLGKVTVDENIFAPLNANGTYPRGDGARFHWGLGAQLGFHFVHDCNWEFGVNLKTPVWFEDFRYHAEDATGLPRTDSIDIDLPMIVSGGLAYRGMEYVLLTADIRYLGYNWADGLGDPAAYQADGSVDGLGWKDQFALAIGAELQLTERIIGRLGYVYASELFDDENTFFNLASDLSYRHMPTFGASYRCNDHTTISAAYNYLISWDSSGRYVLPGAGSIPGSSVTTDFAGHILTVGLNARY